VLDRSQVSAVNLAEVVSKAIDFRFAGRPWA
jgi:hypothetical protein